MPTIAQLRSATRLVTDTASLARKAHLKARHAQQDAQKVQSALNRAILNLRALLTS